MHISRKSNLARGTAVAVASAASLLVGLLSFSAPALALPEGRVYEQVSPLYKGGYGANSIEAVAPNGESVAFGAQGAFAGPSGQTINNGYLARRGASGWSTVSLAEPATLGFDPVAAVPNDFSATLESSLITNSRPGPNGAKAIDTYVESEYLLHPTDAPDTAPNFEVAGMILKAVGEVGFTPGYEGASSNFSHIVFHTAGTEPLLPAAVGAREELYDLVSSGEDAPSLRLVGLNDQEPEPNLINRNCSVELGSGNVGNSSSFNAISVSGSEIFFTLRLLESKTACDNNNQVFVRLGGMKTLEVSRPLSPVCTEVPCAGAGTRAPADFAGASEDGSKVFFTTEEPLAGGVDKTNNLYMATIGCPSGAEGCAVAQQEVTSLVRVSQGLGSAEVQGVAEIAPDGSRVYFVARGVLSAGPNPEGRVAVEGADNLYVYNTVSGGPPVFVTDLCSGPVASGEAREARCPSDLESGEGTRNDKALWSGGGEEQTAGDGRFLLFSSYGRLLPGDTDAARDVYLYDAETGALERVSAGEAGYGANGNSSVCDGSESACNATILSERREALVATKARLRTRAINEAGTRVVFTTAAALSPDATNGLENVYEWHKEPGWSEGRVSLVSTGSATQPVNEVVMSPSGGDVFFVTNQGLVPQDTDGEDDVYDARLGGGFPPLPAPAEPCEGDACQGPLTNPAPLLVPGSVSQAPGGNFAAPVPAVTVKPKAKPAKCKKGYVKKKSKCVKKPKAKGRK